MSTSALEKHVQKDAFCNYACTFFNLQWCLDFDLNQKNDCDTISAVTMRIDKQKWDNDNNSHQSKVETAQTQPKSGKARPANENTNTSVTRKRPEVLQDIVLRDYSDVFEGLGCLAGSYRIQVDPSVKPFVHPPWRVPRALGCEGWTNMHGGGTDSLLLSLNQLCGCWAWLQCGRTQINCGFVWTCMTSTGWYGACTIHCLHLKMSPKYYQFLMPNQVFGKSNYMTIQVTWQCSIHHLGTTAGYGCHLASTQHQRRGKVMHTNWPNHLKQCHSLGIYSLMMDSK